MIMYEPMPQIVAEHNQRLRERYGERWDNHRPVAWFVRPDGTLISLTKPHRDPMGDITASLESAQVVAVPLPADESLLCWLPYPYRTVNSAFYNQRASDAVGFDVYGSVAITEGRPLDRLEVLSNLETAYQLELGERQPPAPDLGL